MKAFLQKFVAWCRNKYGRIITVAGALLSSMETFDITPIKDPLEGMFGRYGHQIVMGLTVGLFVLSWARHQQIAKRISQLEAQIPPKGVPET